VKQHIINKAKTNNLESILSQLSQTFKTTHDTSTS